MLSTTIKRTIATALGGAAMADPSARRPRWRCRSIPGVGEPGDTQIVAPPPRSSAPSAVDTAPDAGFDRCSAAIGAAAGTGVLIVALAAAGWRGAGR